MLLGISTVSVWLASLMARGTYVTKHDGSRVPLCRAHSVPLSLGASRLVGSRSTSYVERDCMRLGLNKFTVSGVIVLLGTLAIMVGGCGSSGGSGVLPDSQQVLRIPLVVTDIDIKTMDPALDADYYSYFPIFMTFPNLVTLDQNGNITPWAAASMPSFNSATNTYTFHVRPDLKWSDGTPIDANTFAYSINRSLSPCTGSRGDLLHVFDQRRPGVLDAKVRH